jgi:hypothetical protein
VKDDGCGSVCTHCACKRQHFHPLGLYHYQWCSYLEFLFFPLT